MPQFLIFDSEATEDSRGNPVAMSLDAAVDEEHAVRTLPVRLFGAQNVGFQFVAYFVQAYPTISWFMEFYADNPSLQALPNARTWPGIPLTDPAWPWAREQIEEMASGGLIRHYKIIREAHFTGPEIVDPSVLAIYFPMQVYGVWVRLAVWANPEFWDPTSRLYIFATEGGYDQELAAEQSIVPWAG